MNFVLTSLDIFLILLIAVLTLSIFYFLKSLFNKSSKLSLTEQKFAQIFNEYQSLKDSIAKKENYLNSLRQDFSSLREIHAATCTEKKRFFEDNEALKKKIAEIEEEKSDLKEAMSAAYATLDAERQMREDDRKKMVQNQEELQNRLTVLGQQMLKTTANELSNQERLNFQKNVAPLKEELETFRRFLTQSQNLGAQRSGALLTEIQKLQMTQNILSKQALDLSNALSSGGKSQGMWGELQLERVLEASGLTNGIEYEREVAGSRALGETGRPDAVIRLPQNHCLIIDAKCSLTAYTQYINAEDKKIKEEALKNHIFSLKNHIQGLAKRDYCYFKSLNSPSFVFMFVPIDGALSLAINSDSTLYDEASKKNIYLVSPSSLIPALRVSANLWVLSNQNEKIRALAIEAQQIYTKFSAVISALDDVEKKNNALNSSLDVLNLRLRAGKGNLEGQLKNFSVKAPGVLENKATKEIENMTDTLS